MASVSIASESSLTNNSYKVTHHCFWLRLGLRKHKRELQSPQKSKTDHLVLQIQETQKIYSPKVQIRKKYSGHIEPKIIKMNFWKIIKKQPQIQLFQFNNGNNNTDFLFLTVWRFYFFPRFLIKWKRDIWVNQNIKCSRIKILTKVDMYKMCFHDVIQVHSAIWSNLCHCSPCTPPCQTYWIPFQQENS